MGGKSLYFDYIANSIETVIRRSNFTIVHGLNKRPHQNLRQNTLRTVHERVLCVNERADEILFSKILLYTYTCESSQLKGSKRIAEVMQNNQSEVYECNYELLDSVTLSNLSRIAAADTALCLGIPYYFVTT